MTAPAVHTGGIPTPEGAPILLLHGAGMDHTVWRHQTRWLARRGWAVTAPDLPGHGATPGPALVTIEEMATWVTQWVAGGPATVMGHSMGALVAIQLAATHPDLVSRLVLVGASPRMRVHPQLLDAARHDLPRAARLVAGWSFPAAFGGGHPEPGTWEPAATIRLLERSTPGVLVSDLAACHTFDPAAAMAAVACPTVVVAGSQDRMTPAKGAEEVAAAIPGAELVILAGLGHEPMAQDPRRFNAVVESRLRP